MIVKKNKMIIKVNPWRPDLPEKLPSSYIPRRTLDFKAKYNLKHDVESSIQHGLEDEFEYLLLTWRNGSDCFDCDKEVLDCTCERECEDCGHVYDACSCSRTPEEIAKITWEFVKIAMTKKELENLKRSFIDTSKDSFYINNSDIFTDVYKKIITSKVPFKPSYPKYKKIARELFEL